MAEDIKRYSFCSHMEQKVKLTINTEENSIKNDKEYLPLFFPVPRFFPLIILTLLLSF